MADPTLIFISEDIIKFEENIVVLEKNKINNLLCPWWLIKKFTPNYMNTKLHRKYGYKLSGRNFGNREKQRFKLRMIRTAFKSLLCSFPLSPKQDSKVLIPSTLTYKMKDKYSLLRILWLSKGHNICESGS